MSGSVLCSHSICGDASVDVDDPRQDADEADAAAGWSKRTAPQISVVAAPPPPWRRIS